MIDFAALNASIAARAREWLEEHLPGGRVQGAEYVCGSIQGGKGKSFNVHLETGKFIDFATNDAGGDYIALYALQHGMGQRDAALALGAPDDAPAGLNGSKPYTNGHAHAAAPKVGEPPIEMPRAPKPPYQITTFKHSTHGLPAAHWVYRDALLNTLYVVCRYNTGEGAKEIVPWTWSGERWVAKSYPKPRPLYGLDRLAHLEGPVLIVEGEKTADAGARWFPNSPCITWSGGARAVKTADWSPVLGRPCILWPDNDDAGREAMATLAALLLKAGGKVNLIDTDDSRPPGWDLADATPQEAIHAYVASHQRALGTAPPQVQPSPPRAVPETNTAAPDPPPAYYDEAPAPFETPADPDWPAEPDPLGQYETGTLDTLEPPPRVDPPKPDRLSRLQTSPPGAVIEPPAFSGSLMATYQQYGFHLKSNGRPYANQHNVGQAITARRATGGITDVYFDEFANRVMVIDALGREQEWSDAMTLQLTVWLQDNLELYEMRPTTVMDGVAAYAFSRPRNPVREWLQSLTWDGAQRLLDLLPTGFGTDRSDYHEAVGRCFMMGMVARVLKPGCQVDAMPVFEGSQGNGKTSALRLIGGAYFAEVHDSIMSKDFLITLSGKMLCEISELGAFRAADIDRIKGIITTTTDRFRAPYARSSQDHARQCVFSGTTNRDNWNTDDTGARRFWPVTCTAIDLEWIRTHREQLFAEAVYRVQDGQSWWDVPNAEADALRELRQDDDPWEDLITEYLRHHNEVRITHIMTNLLSLKVSEMDHRAQTRIGKILRRNHFRKNQRWSNGENLKFWERKP